MSSLRNLLQGLVDYAGLFPPAAQPMAKAVECFGEYRRCPQAWMLGRLVVPATRLEELEAAAGGLLPAPGECPWELSVLGEADPSETTRALLGLERRHPAGGIAATSVEMKAPPPELLQQALTELPKTVEVFFEIPCDEDPTPWLERLTDSRGRGKIRCGGVTEDAFPTPRQMARFLRACNAAKVPFKATAGLHHPLRGSYRLTYEPDSPSGTMFGFLNVFAAAAFLHSQELPEEDLLALLTEEKAEAFSFSPSGLGWRDRALSSEQVAASRSRLALSYGSCSFREPIEDLQALDLL